MTGVSERSTLQLGWMAWTPHSNITIPRTPALRRLPSSVWNVISWIHPTQPPWMPMGSVVGGVIILIIDSRPSPADLAQAATRATERRAPALPWSALECRSDATRASPRCYTQFVPRCTHTVKSEASIPTSFFQTTSWRRQR